jgi:hypothetical protein
VATFAQLFDALAEPFTDEEHDIHERVYPTAIMRRLDKVCGRGEWRDEYQEVRTGKGVACSLSIFMTDDLGEQKEVKRTAVAGYADGPPGAVVEEAYDEAFRRAAAKCGINRAALYRQNSPQLRPDDWAGEMFNKPANRDESHALQVEAARPPAPDPPRSAPANVPDERPETIPMDRQSRRQEGGLTDDEGKPVPTVGRNFLGWLNGKEEKFKVALFEDVKKFGKDHEIRGFVKEWDEESLAEAGQFVLDKIRALPDAVLERAGAIEWATGGAMVPKKSERKYAPPPPDDDNPPPSPRKSAQAPNRKSAQAPNREPFKVDANDPLSTVKKDVCSIGRTEYFARNEEPPTDANFRDFLNDWMRDFDAPQFSLPGGIHEYNDEGWLKWLANSLRKARDKRNPPQEASA